MELMTTIYMITGVVMAVVCLIGWEFSGRWAYLTSRASRRLLEAESTQHLENLVQVPKDTLEYHLKESQLKLTPAQFYLLALGFGVLGTLLSWVIFIPGLPSLAIGIILAYLPFGYIHESARSRGRLIDEKLAIALSRITPGLQVNRSLADVLEEVAHSLNAEGSNPLSPELLLTAKDIRSRNLEGALRDLAKRSPSLSLANVAMLLESYQRSGGGQYAQVFSATATAIQRILAVRTHAQAKAAQPLQSARLIPAMLGVILLVMMNDPVTRASFAEPLVQVVMAIAMGVMLAGYLFMRSEVLKAV